MKYEVKIVKLGEMAEEFLDSGMMIIFNDNAPPELAEISVLHTRGTLEEEVAVGDHVKIGDMEYRVTAVGWEANKTLKELGHCTFKFSDSDKEGLPGEICLEQKGKPKVNIGEKILIY